MHIRTILPLLTRLSSVGLWGLIGLVFSYSVHAQFETIEIGSQQQSAMGLKVAEVETVNAYPLMSVVAVAEYAPGERYELNAVLDGKVMAIHRVNGKVEQNEPLITLQSPKWVELQAELLTAQIELETAIDSYQRIKQLAKSGAASTKKVNQARVAVTQWRSKKAMLKAMLESAGMASVQIQKLLSTHQIIDHELIVRAPIRGVVHDVNVKIGQQVEPGTGLMTIGNERRIGLVAALPVDVVDHFKPGDSVKLPGYDQNAQIEMIDYRVDALTQSVKVYLSLPEGVRVLPGEVKPVQFTLSFSGPLYRIAETALSKLQGKNVVYTQQDNRLMAHSIRVATVKNGQLFFYLPNRQAMTHPLLVVEGTAAVKAAFQQSVTE